ncbi:hypothetical protein C8A00DRAFT_11056 [Chaetomidium leptoderma]|uniref:Uncharacterized protein n=1 Tax=Chaetomidium leptoderma TaxID=669021 RepID=A0AAN6VWL1_9PEZI|nr:hypothetical protein C8A00DRAFT_11056 [Chaetomidium leptoderma]
MNAPDTEILVHIAAPARAADDTKYRTLAAGYLNFEPTTRTLVALGAPTDIGSEVCRRVGNPGRGSCQTEGIPQPTPSLGVIQSPMLSFRSAANNFGSPRLQQPAGGNITETQSSWRPPPSVIEDSMPDIDFAFPQYCTPTRILEHYTSGLDSTRLSTSPISRKCQNQTLPVSSPRQSNSPSLRAQGGSGQQEPVHQDLSTVIPLSPRRDDKRNRPTTLTESAVVEETRIVSSYPSQHSEPTSSFRAESEPPLSKRPRTSRDPEPGKPLARSISDIGPQPQQQRNTPARYHHQLPDTLEILSPPPITGQRDLRPEDMITDVLARLARELNLEKRFRPSSQARALRPFERGYWLVDCAGWDADLKRSAWAFLTDYLGQGAAGWGTSCRRDRDFARLRLYCWGGAVGHMYLVLYLMSKRRVLGTGASWIGAEGEPVVVMAPRPGLA